MSTATATASTSILLKTMAGDLLPLAVRTDATMEQFYQEVQRQLFPDTECLTHLLLHRCVMAEEDEVEEEEKEEVEEKEKEFWPIPIEPEPLCPLEGEVFFVLVGSSTLPYHDTFLGVFPYDVHASHDNVDITACVRVVGEGEETYQVERYRVVELAFYDNPTQQRNAWSCCHVEDYAVRMPRAPQEVGKVYRMEEFQDMEVSHTYQGHVPRQGYVFARSRIAPRPDQALTYRDLIPLRIQEEPYFETHTFYRSLALVKRIQQTMRYFMDYE